MIWPLKNCLHDLKETFSQDFWSSQIFHLLPNVWFLSKKKRNEPLRWKFTKCSIYWAKKRNGPRILRNHVNEKQTENLCQTRTKTFYRKFNQFIWKSVWKLTPLFFRRISTPPTLASRLSPFIDEEENEKLCVLQLVLLRLYHCYFLPHKFYGLSQKRRGSIKIFILPLFLRSKLGLKNQARLKTKRWKKRKKNILNSDETLCWRRFFYMNKGRKIVIQMEISTSLVILAFIITTMFSF